MTLSSLRSQVLEVLFPSSESQSTDPTVEEDQHDDDDVEQQTPSQSQLVPTTATADEEQALPFSTEDCAKQNGEDEESTVALCAICLDRLIAKEPQQTTGVPCGHTFHHDCIMKWMAAEHDDCPTCRQPLWNAETYNAVAISIDPLYDPNQQQQTPEEQQQQQPYRQVSQQTHFRLAYFILAAVMVQILVFSLFIYTSNQNFPPPATIPYREEAPRFNASQCSPRDNNNYSVIPVNATVTAQCQYALACALPDVPHQLSCDCTCYRFRTMLLAHYNATTRQCVCTRPPLLL